MKSDNGLPLSQVINQLWLNKEITKGGSVKTINCKECSKVDALVYTKSINEKLEKRQLCWSCNFWQDHIKNVNDIWSVRVVGKQYYVHGEDDAGPRGFGGMPFTIRFSDGRVVHTTNLWCCGEIPERFRNRLTDNAIFM